LDLKELRDELHHMDEQELLAFGRKFRSMPHSEEMKEASAEWKRRKETRKETKPEPPMDSLTSEDLTKMAAAAGPGRYPWIRYQD
jgi:hypothetical protein